MVTIRANENRFRLVERRIQQKDLGSCQCPWLGDGRKSMYLFVRINDWGTVSGKIDKRLSHDPTRRQFKFDDR